MCHAFFAHLRLIRSLVGCSKLVMYGMHQDRTMDRGSGFQPVRVGTTRDMPDARFTGLLLGKAVTAFNSVRMPTGSSGFVDAGRRRHLAAKRAALSGIPRRQILTIEL